MYHGGVLDVAMGSLVQGVFPDRRSARQPARQEVSQQVSQEVSQPVSQAAAPIPSSRRGWDQRQRLWWLLWSRCPGVGWVRLQGLEAAFGGLETAWAAPSEAFAALPGWHGGLVEGLARFRDRWGADPLGRLLRQPRPGVGVLVPGDRRWPLGMQGLQRPPLALYWQGRGSLWSPLQERRAVAVVGTRRPSPHGLAMARRLGGTLARAGWPVVSGLAEGIDGAVHDACLEHGGAPVGVLGTPLDRVYPRHHAELQRRVAGRGLLVSELPHGARVQAGHFASRNRLQVALAAAVVVVECPQASGALHSADLAWREGLPLWVIPADAGKASAAGSNRLLAQGATPLLAPVDLIQQLGPGPLSPGPGGPGHRRPGGPGERALMEALGDGASLEQLSLALARPAAALAGQLLELELAGVLRAEPGLRWRPC